MNKQVVIASNHASKGVSIGNAGDMSNKKRPAREVLHFTWHQY